MRPVPSVKRGRALVEKHDFSIFLIAATSIATIAATVEAFLIF